ncbi:major facilitator superfamily domain-containing protein [Fusarium solani]|uniref:Major facilitator superfamily domain-containing protein n=1 Tax=Fusarium solani TaxID=169388 RepID=A0A9P9GEB0_FUSSL|nr:major facilitator superfamily domain-containing protein [Fusarium solani]KAH7237955.1 major facilitator superfamily domain-containing protein [Fusarium solani]
MAKFDTPGKDVAVGEQLELATSCDGDAAQAAYVAAVEALTPDEQKRTIRRIDVRLVSTLGFLYCVSLMDRNNTGIAMISGMSTDLVMTGSRYSIVVLLFFIPYVLFQPPSTAILRKVGPRLFLSLTTLVWGLATIASGFVKNWSELIPLRLILGACEAGFFPGCAYLLSCWYPRYELQKRNAVFYLIGTTMSAFSGVLALGFSQLDGHGAGPSWWGRVVVDKETGVITVQSGISGWRWIFILQGVLTCVVAGFAYLTVLGFPDAVSHVLGLKLSKREADFIVARIELDRADATAERFSLREYLANAFDLKIWGFAALFGLTTVNTYAIAYFLPLILKDGLGFSVAVSQCLIAPPYIAAGIAMYTMAHLSDKYRIRSPFIVFNGCLLLVGLPLLGFATNVGARYFGAFVTTTACNANVPCILTWQANNIRGQWKRALCSATLVGTGGIGGIIGSTVFRSQDAPGYRPGIYAAMIASSLIILITLALDAKFFRANKRAAAGGKIIGGLEGFRYTL